MKVRAPRSARVTAGFKNVSGAPENHLLVCRIIQPNTWDEPACCYKGKSTFSLVIYQNLITNEYSLESGILSLEFFFNIYKWRVKCFVLFFRESRADISMLHRVRVNQLAVFRNINFKTKISGLCMRFAIREKIVRWAMCALCNKGKSSKVGYVCILQ